jgi:thiol-disulfide isomerase/thioredoxin
MPPEPTLSCLGSPAERLPALLCVGLVAAFACAAPVPELSGRTLDGKAFDLLDPPPEGPTALVFVATDCPISNRYAPAVRRLYDELGPRGVRFFLVYVDPALPPEAAARHRREYDLAMPALIDDERRLVLATGVEVTPEAAVLDTGGRLLYRGRIDDRYVDFGRYRPEASREDLRLALEAVLAGADPPVAEARAVGCYIPPLPDKSGEG